MLVKHDQKGSLLMLCKYDPGTAETLIVLEKSSYFSGPPSVSSILRRSPAILGQAPGRRERKTRA